MTSNPRPVKRPNDADRAAAVVGDAVQVDERAAAASPRFDSAHRVKANAGAGNAIALSERRTVEQRRVHGLAATADR